MKYFIGADLGTSALKLLLVDVHGETLKTVSRSYSVYYPKPAWSEQNPEDWWNAFLSGVKELVQDINPDEIAGIGVGGQMHGLTGGFNFDSKTRRPSYTVEDMVPQEELYAA